MQRTLLLLTSLLAADALHTPKTNAARGSSPKLQAATMRQPATVPIAKPKADDPGSDAMTAILADIRKKFAHQPLFLQAVHECAESVAPLLAGDSAAADRNRRAFAAMAEPERCVSFRVSWRNAQGVLEHNRGWRVQYNSALGPYKGGLRFHPTVDEGTLKFLGFEQIFKNALTGLAMGGGKGGSDFDPRGRADSEVAAFCAAFMGELSRHIGPDTDVPAGDINVGGREIGYLFGAYKKIANKDQSVLTGKGLDWGGSLIRPEATGYGCVYFAREALANELGIASFTDCRCAVSGSGNVAQFAAEKLLELGACVVSLSDSKGHLVKDAGFDADDLAALAAARNVDRVSLEVAAPRVAGAAYAPGSLWANVGGLRVDAAFPCATQNEIHADAAQALVDGGCVGVFEGANMPSTRSAVAVFKKEGLVYGPGKAANAGGVGVSGLEMAQNAARGRWTREAVDAKLEAMMKDIYGACAEHAPAGGLGASGVRDLEVGANRASFLKVAAAMDDLGWI